MFEKDLIELYTDEIDDATNYLFHSSISNLFDKYYQTIYKDKYPKDIFKNKLNNYIDELIHIKKLRNIIDKYIGFPEINKKEEKVYRLYDTNIPSFIFIHQVDILYDEEKKAVLSYYNFLNKYNINNNIKDVLVRILKDEEMHYIDMSLFSCRADIEYMYDLLKDSNIIEFLKFYKDFFYKYFNFYISFLKDKNIKLFDLIFIDLCKYYLYVNREVEYDNCEFKIINDNINQFLSNIKKIISMIINIKNILEEKKYINNGFYQTLVDIVFKIEKDEIL